MPMGDHSVQDGYTMMHPEMSSRTMTNGIFNYHVIIAGIIVFALFLLAFVISNDATRRGRSGIFWGFATLVAPFLSIPIYLVLIMSGSKPTHSPIIEPETARTYEPRVTQYQVERPIRQKSIEPPMTIPEQSNPITKTSVQFCTTCGLKNSLEATYCNGCGNKVVS